MAADRMDTDRQHIRNILAGQSFVNEPQHLLLPDGQQIGGLLFAHLQRFARHGIDHDCWGELSEHPWGVEAQAQPQGALAGSRNVEDPMPHRQVAALPVLHPQRTGEVIVGSSAAGLPFDKLEKTEFLPMFAGQIVRVHPLEDLLLPDGRDDRLLLPLAEAQRLRKATVVDVADMRPQIAQYRNGIFRTCIVVRQRFVGLQTVRIGLLFGEVQRRKRPVQFLDRIHQLVQNGY